MSDVDGRTLRFRSVDYDFVVLNVFCTHFVSPVFLSGSIGIHLSCRFSKVPVFTISLIVIEPSVLTSPLYALCLFAGSLVLRVGSFLNTSAFQVGFVPFL